MTLKQKLKRCPRYVQVAYHLSGYLIKQKDRIPEKERVGQYALLPLEIGKACRRYKCSRQTLFKAVFVLKDMGLASPLIPHQ